MSHYLAAAASEFLIHSVIAVGCDSVCLLEIRRILLFMVILGAASVRQTFDRSTGQLWHCGCFLEAISEKEG